MCLDCGCHEPADDHGDERHITMQRLLEAAQASQISVQEAAYRIAEEVRQIDTQSPGAESGR